VITCPASAGSRQMRKSGIVLLGDTQRCTSCALRDDDVAFPRVVSGKASAARIRRSESKPAPPKGPGAQDLGRENPRDNTRVVLTSYWPRERPVRRRQGGEARRYLGLDVLARSRTDPTKEATDPMTPTAISA
jgi:hypothetical protein